MNILQHCIAIIMMAAAMISLIALFRWGERIVSEFIRQRKLEALVDRAIENPESLTIEEGAMIIDLAGKLDDADKSYYKFSRFKELMQDSYKGQVSPDFILEQWKRCNSGEVGVSICDAALLAWSACQKVGW